MAPKRAEMIENPPLASSSEEEEEESGSSGEESESSGEESNKDESSDDEGDEQSKPIQTSIVPVAAKKLVADSEGESESDSDSDPEPAKKKKPHNTVKTKPMPETSGSMTTKSTLPESSTAKRSLTQTDDEVKKKMKASTTEHVKKPSTEEEVKKISGDETKQQMFQRLFSETDEIALLQGILDFTSTRGDPQKEMDGFCDYVKKLINFNANKSQLVTKIQRLKKKFVTTVNNALKKGKSEDQMVFSKDLDQKAFELSRKIWGNNGVMASKSRKKVGGNPKEIKLAYSPKKVDESKKPEFVNTSLYSREIAYFFKGENVTAFGLDDLTISAGWDMVADGPRKREMEEKWKELKATQVELCLQRTGLIADSAKVVFKDNASSSGM